MLKCSYSLGNLYMFGCIHIVTKADCLTGLIRIPEMNDSLNSISSTIMKNSIAPSFPVPGSSQGRVSFEPYYFPMLPLVHRLISFSEWR